MGGEETEQIYSSLISSRGFTQMCGADVEAACMTTEEEFVCSFTRAVRCVVRKPVDGMGLIYAPQNFSTFDGGYHGFYIDKGNDEDLPQRTGCTGIDDSGLHGDAKPQILPSYRSAASVFVESLSRTTKRRRMLSKSPDRCSLAGVSEVDRVDLINDLPDECLQEIFGHLSKVQDRCAAAAVCMRWLMLQSRMRRGDFKAESGSKYKGGCIQDDSCTTKNGLISVAEKSDVWMEELSDVRGDWSDEAPNAGTVGNVDEVHPCGNEMDIEIDEEQRVQMQPPWVCGAFSRILQGMEATDVMLALVAIGELARGGLVDLKVIGGLARDSKGISDSGLIAIGNCCTGLKSLTLWGCENITDVGLAAIGSGCHTLEKLDIMKCPGIGDRGLQAIAKGCPLLSTVSIDTCSNVGDASLKALGMWSGSLSSLSLTNCPIVGSAGISMVTSGCSKLMKLKLEKLRLSNKGLIAIGGNCKSVTRMKLANLSWCAEEGFLGCFGGSGLKQLKCLVITFCPGFTDFTLEKVGKVCQDLKTCVLSQCQSITDRGLLGFMQFCTRLDSLQLERCHAVTNAGVLAALARGKGNLRKLNLSKCDSFWNGEKRAEDLPLRCLSLKTLNVTECKNVGFEPIVTMGSCCPSLENLDLSELTDLNDEAIISIIEVCGEHLVNLNLTNCKNITDVAVAAIASRCGDLERLILDGCYQVGDDGVRKLAAECSLLKELDLSGTSITDSGLRSLVTSRGLFLQGLTFTGCVNLTDECLSLIEDCCPSLGALNLRNCPLLTRAGLSSLESQLWSCDDFVSSYEFN